MGIQVAPTVIEVGECESSSSYSTKRTEISCFNCGKNAMDYRKLIKDMKLVVLEKGPEEHL
ncbi:hypothetical protein COLO4_28271 [Corchorus olitorius]|uniref:Uncharacterized protein n=1 Tax=Corchorus olitorius TaxID=93759 RepID=A0A1R3HLZ5_9ROSI|nr:hypothetical protein COLO4_28271 [Corchorus olitorius]